MEKDNERIEKYKQLNEKLQNLYASPEAGATMYVAYKTYNLPEENYKTYAEIVGDTILGFNKISDMPRIFQQKLKVSADESQRMTSQLIEMLEPVVKREEAEAQEKKEMMTNLADTFAKPEGLGKLTEQESIEKVEPIRTMAQDMNRVHGYGAYRAQGEEFEQKAEKESLPEGIQDTVTEKEEPNVDNSHR